jgi:hypothetical protein
MAVERWAEILPFLWEWPQGRSTQGSRNTVLVGRLYSPILPSAKVKVSRAAISFAT